MNRKIQITIANQDEYNDDNNDDHARIQQWVQQTLDSAPNYLGNLYNQTESDIVAENRDALFRELKPTDQSTYNCICSMLDGLSGYRIVDDISELVRGRYLRWISRKTLQFKWKQYLMSGTTEHGIETGFNSRETAFPVEHDPSPTGFKPGITAGGFLTNITMTDSGTKLTWRSRTRMGCILLDDCIVFQALTNEEKLYLSIQEL
jgi:hypothetical protein